MITSTVNPQNEVSSQTELEVQRSVHLATVEMLLGSVGHGFKIPFTGQFLSLYQLNVLSHARNRDGLPKRAAVEISGVVAVLKTLSPTGKKIGPMFSILMQGTLYWLGMVLGGAGLFGQLLGAAFLSVWSFVQPFMTFFVIFGFDFYEIIQAYKEKVNQDYAFAQNYIYAGFVFLVAVKMLLAFSVVLRSRSKYAEWRLQTEPLHAWARKNATALSHSNSTGLSGGLTSAPWCRALRDLLNPLFLVSVILLFLFSWQVQSHLGLASLAVLRVLAIGYVIFYLARSSWFALVLQKAAARSKLFQRFHGKAEIVLHQVKQQIAEMGARANR